MSEELPPDSPSLLDPTDWEAYRGQAHALLDRMVDRLRDAGEGRVWTPMPEPVKERLATSPFSEANGLPIALDELSELILPYGNGNTHPRFWGWVQGTGNAGGVLAEMVAATMNPNCAGRDHGAIYVERAVIGWACRWFGLPETAGGLLVTGSSMANMLALAVARHHKTGHDVRKRGIAGVPLIAYASTEVHAASGKGMELLGLGRENLHGIPTGNGFSMDIAALRATIAADRAAGLKPFCVIGTAGTVNSGAYDNLNAIADLCRDEQLWMHVDGAFGGLAVLHPDLAPLAAGIERADSIAFDYHKWLHVPYDAGCVLVRDAELQRATFGGRPDYLANIGGLSAGEPWPTDFGVELSRGFRALKIWFLVKEHGSKKLGQAIARNCAQARLLAGLLGKTPEIELAAPVSLNIVCCRYRAPGLDEDALERLNARIAVTIQESGVAAFSTCRIGGRLCLRICITNHRTRNSDLAIVASAITETGRELSAGKDFGAP